MTNCSCLRVQRIKCLPAMRETWVRSLGWEDPLEKEMATHSSILAWRIPWTEEPDGLQSMGSQRVGHNWATSQDRNTEGLKIWATLEDGKFTFSKYYFIKFINIFLWVLFCPFLKKVFIKKNNLKKVFLLSRLKYIYLFFHSIAHLYMFISISASLVAQQ